MTTIMCTTRATNQYERLREFYIAMNTLIDGVSLNDTVYLKSCLNLDNLVDMKLYTRVEIERSVIDMIKTRIKDNLRKQQWSDPDYILYLYKCQDEILLPEDPKLASIYRNQETIDQLARLSANRLLRSTAENIINKFEEKFEEYYIVYYSD